MLFEFFLIDEFKNKFEISFDNVEGTDVLSEDFIIYSDRNYEIEVYSEDNQFDIYFNNILFEYEIIDNKIISKLYKHKNIFCEFFGFIQIEINFRDKRENLYSNYFNVVSNNEKDRKNIYNMLDYILNNNSAYLTHNNLHSKNLMDLKENCYKNFETYILLFKEINFNLKIYYDEFKKNAQYKLIIKDEIKDFNKLKVIDSKTMEYILRNPQYLEISESLLGIEYDNEYYIPKKALNKSLYKDYSILENKIIVSFIITIYKKIESIIKEIENISKIENSKVNFPYVSIKDIVRNTSINYLNKFIIDLKVLKDDFSKIIIKYKKLFGVSINYELIKIPNISNIFIGKLIYKKFYIMILNWFKKGNYSLETEKFLLSFSKSSEIFEIFTLLKISDYYQKLGFILTNKNLYNYSLPINARFKNSKIENTFHFKKDFEEITLYYQPIIFWENKNENNLNLFRNNNISFNFRVAYKPYYSPDFIVKKTINKKSSYLILDNKFSEINTVKNFYFKEFIFKYVMSISTIFEDDIVEGAYLIAAKDENDKGIINFYNSQFTLRNEDIIPKVKIFSFSNNDNFNDIQFLEFNNKFFS